jgi:hypothetical protein
VAGYAAALEAFDRRLPDLLAVLRPATCGDHRRPATTRPSAAPTTEHVPILASARASQGGLDGGGPSPTRRDGRLPSRPRTGPPRASSPPSRPRVPPCAASDPFTAPGTAAGDCVHPTPLCDGFHCGSAGGDHT